jgi:hypothetical protein
MESEDVGRSVLLLLAFLFSMDLERAGIDFSSGFLRGWETWSWSGFLAEAKWDNGWGLGFGFGIGFGLATLDWISFILASI